MRRSPISKRTSDSWNGSRRLTPSGKPHAESSSSFLSRARKTYGSRCPAEAKRSVGRFGVEHAEEERHEHPLRRRLHDDVVQDLEDADGRGVVPDLHEERGLRHRHHDAAREAVAGHVAEGEPEPASRKGQEIEIVAADLRRRAVVRDHGGARRASGCADGQERGLDPVRGVDLGLDALALDDALHVRREVLVRVRDAPPRREARAPRRARGRRAAATSARSGARARRDRTRRPRAAAGRRARPPPNVAVAAARRSDAREDEERPPRSRRSRRRARRPSGPTGGETILMRTPNAAAKTTPTREEALAVERPRGGRGAPTHEKMSASSVEDEDDGEGPGDRVQRLDRPVAERAQTAPDFRRSGGPARSAAAATAGAARSARAGASRRPSRSRGRA